MQLIDGPRKMTDCDCVFSRTSDDSAACVSVSLLKICDRHRGVISKSVQQVSIGCDTKEEIENEKMD